MVVANRYAFDSDVVTGRQIKEKANIPPDFALDRRMRGGNVSIRDDASVELHEGDHFFARPLASRWGLDDEKRSRDETEPTSGTARADAGPAGMHVGHYDVLHHVFFGGRRRCVFTRERSRAVKATEPGVGA